MTADQPELEGLSGDYARPPESPEPREPKPPDRLATLAAEYNDAQRSGIIEGALWACWMFAELAGDVAADVADLATADIESALRHRFGGEAVDREKRARETSPTPKDPTT
jgi:hypothetical protein